MPSSDLVEQMVVDDESGEMASTTPEENGDMEEADGVDDQGVEGVADEAVKIPDNWPESVPIPNEAGILHVKVENDQNGTEVLAMTFTIREGVVGMSDYYTKALVDNGWDIEIQTEIANGSVISAGHEDGKEVSVFITEVGQNEVSVTVSVAG